MKIRAKITILLSVFVLISLALVVVQYRTEKNRTVLLLNGVRVQEQAFYSSVVDLSSSNVAVFVSDYTFWDEMVDFVHTPTEQFINDYLLESLDTYRTNRIYVYDADAKPVYAYRNAEEPARLPELPTEAFEAFRKSRLAHFYLIEDGELIEYHAATIHPTNDPERATEPQGFLIVGNSWNADYIASLEKLSGTTIQKPGENPPAGGVSFLSDVHSWDGTAVTTFLVTAPVPILKEASAASSEQLYVIIGSLMLLLLITSIFLQVFVGRPIEVLSESIERKDFGKLKDLRKSRSEFGELASMVIGFSEHELVLQAKAKDDAILSAVGNGLIAIDTEGKVILLNATGEKLLGSTTAKALGSSVSALFRIETRDGTPVSSDSFPLFRALATRTVQTATFMGVRDDGTKFPMTMTAAPVILDGAVIGAVQDFRDITQEEAVEHAKSDFVSLVSHELRTPLTALRWSVTSMEAEPGAPKDMLALMSSAIFRMRTLVTAILDVSRIEAGTFPIGHAKIAVPTVLSKILDDLKPFITAKKLSLKSVIPTTVRDVYSDEQLFQIVVGSIITNAVKYSPEKGTVRVTVTEEDAALQIDIANTGPGIPFDEQEKIFTKMFRAGNARLMNPDGTGLGLYISKSFIERLGGSIRFTSVPDQETVFSICLPYGTEKRT